MIVYENHLKSSRFFNIFFPFLNVPTIASCASTQANQGRSHDPLAVTQRRRVRARIVTQAVNRVKSIVSHLTNIISPQVCASILGLFNHPGQQVSDSAQACQQSPQLQGLTLLSPLPARQVRYCVLWRQSPSLTV